MNVADCPTCGVEPKQKILRNLEDKPRWYRYECPDCGLAPERHSETSAASVKAWNETATLGHNVEVCDGGRKTSELKQDANRHSQH